MAQRHQSQRHRKRQGTRNTREKASATEFALVADTVADVCQLLHQSKELWLFVERETHKAQQLNASLETVQAAVERAQPYEDRVRQSAKNGRQKAESVDHFVSRPPGGVSFGATVAMYVAEELDLIAYCVASLMHVARAHLVVQRCLRANRQEWRDMFRNSVDQITDLGAMLPLQTVVTQHKRRRKKAQRSRQEKRRAARRCQFMVTYSRLALCALRRRNQQRAARRRTVDDDCNNADD